MELIENVNEKIILSHMAHTFNQRQSHYNTDGILGWHQEMCVYLLWVSLLFELIAIYSQASISVVDKGILPLEKDSVAIQFFLDIENRHPSKACRVISSPYQCCIYNLKQSDCSSTDIYGGYTGFVKPKDRDTVIFILPSIYQHDQFGYCNFILEYQCDRNKRLRKETVGIHLDTRIKNKDSFLLLSYIGDKKPLDCDTIDQNSLDNCVSDCDLKYLGSKSFYNKDVKRCTEVTACLSDADNELPDKVYIVDTNMCRDYEHPITLADIYAISTRMGVVTESPKVEQEKSIEVRSNCSTISQNIYLLRDMLNGKLCSMTGGSNYGKCCKAAIIHILKHIGIICILVLAFLFFFSIIMLLWKKWSDGELDDYCSRTKIKQKKNKRPTCKYVNTEVKNELLKDVIVRDIPIELRESVCNICDRIGEDVKRKRRYRRFDLGSQISLNRAEGNSADISSESGDEKRTLVEKP